MLGIRKPTPVNSIIGPGMQVQGPCTFQGSLQIDGTVVGDVTSDGGTPGLLVIGENGVVRGAISAEHVVISGSVVGTVQARELLELQSKARVQGDVRYKSLEMQQGAVIAGQLQPQVTPPPAPAQPREPDAQPTSGADPRHEPTEPTLDLDRP
ncbi:polymer-forming cytoskeletal protein [Ottowia sp.]|uniref:bactofilin family protein n=1 Tax=Ottowia sp. TaxID=1898956 RepID=UPI002C278DDF|nr:polymer-forming cytoskeletal protein [Ottowia sp.]HOB66139.1 polymer-forming cytoskeletal protein [Ottowia sp.]HPZ58314.1 polymer-forming cytoskeletal protein [Ottowia sp.]HQD47152.1 polymer-forming cytoskeletal protein [Ottowia sp.]